MGMKLGPVTFDLGTMTMTLGILWTLLCPRYCYQYGQFVSVDYPLMCMGMEFSPCDLWPWSCDLDLGILVDPPVSMAMMLTWPICACGLCMSSRCARAWNFGPVAFDIGVMTSLWNSCEFWSCDL